VGNKANIALVSTENDLALYREYTTGRPPVFNDPNDIVNKFTEYIKYCIDSQVMPTVTGTALYLGFSSRQSFYDYEKCKEFSYAMKRIRLYLEHLLENGLYKSINPTAFIFGLKNFGWTDTKQITHTGKVEHILGKSQIVPPDEIILERINNNPELSDKEKQDLLNKLNIKQPVEADYVVTDENLEDDLINKHKQSLQELSKK